MLQRDHILVHFRHTDVLVYAENAYYTFCVTIGYVGMGIIPLLSEHCPKLHGDGTKCPVKSVVSRKFVWYSRNEKNRQENFLTGKKPSYLSFRIPIVI